MINPLHMVVGGITFLQNLMWVKVGPLANPHSKSMINQERTDFLSTNSTIRKLMERDTIIQQIILMLKLDGFMIKLLSTYDVYDILKKT